MRGLVDAPNPQTYNARPILGPIVGLKGAGWSSLVARRAHNPKVVGSNPPPATKVETRQLAGFLQYVVRLVASLIQFF